MPLASECEWGDPLPPHSNIYTRVEGPPRRAHHFEDAYESKKFPLSIKHPMDPAYLISGFLLVVLHSRWRPWDLSRAPAAPHHIPPQRGAYGAPPQLIPPCIYLGPAISRMLTGARSPFAIPAAHLPWISYVWFSLFDLAFKITSSGPQQGACGASPNHTPAGRLRRPTPPHPFLYIDQAYVDCPNHRRETAWPESSQATPKFLPESPQKKIPECNEKHIQKRIESMKKNTPKSG